MMINISQYINQTIMVSIPVLFEDGKCRPFKLLSVDMIGLWLESDELATRLLGDQCQNYASAEPVVFVPFTQIAGVLVATKAATIQPSPPKDDKPSPDPTVGAKTATSNLKGNPKKRH
jgi:hypothetical protein